MSHETPHGLDFWRIIFSILLGTPYPVHTRFMEVDSSIMNSGLKAKWCEALRSGEYAQCSRYMKKKDAYCCLGVLQVIEMSSVEISDYYEYRDFPTNSYLDRVELPIRIAHSLAVMNDDGRSFKSIADEIERSL